MRWGRLARRALALWLAVLFCVLFSACGPKASVLRYDLTSAPRSLDPQFASRESELMIIRNTFEGLVAQTSEGTMELGAAESYETSDDGCTWTFTLREGMVWDDEEKTPVTADDFVFAFHRIFNSISPSPYAQLYTSIQNAQAVLDGSLDVTQLGVSAPDSRTLVFQLEYADPVFLENLSHTAAMPCSRTLFAAQEGKYGSSPTATPSNGPFLVRSWDDSKVLLYRNQNYHDLEAVRSPSVMFYFGRTIQTDAMTEAGETAPSAFQLVLDGSADCCFADYSQIQQAQSQGLSYLTADGQVWALVFNQKNAAFAQETIRQAFSRAVDPSGFASLLPENLSPSDRLVSPGVTLFSRSYTESTTVENPNRYDPSSARTLFQQGLEALGRSTLTDLELLVPDQNNLPALSSLLQQGWQQNLAVSVNVVTADSDSFSSRLSQGDFQMALVPLEADAATPNAVLSLFTSASSSNITGYANATFDQLLHTAGASHDQQQILDSYAQAEQMLLEDAVALPLFTETSYLVLGEGVSGVEILPGSGSLSFRNAVALR